MNQKLLKFMNKNSNPNTPSLNSRNSSSQLTKIKSKHPSKNSIEPSSKTAINEEPQSKITQKSTDPIQKSSENQNPETINLQNILTDESNQVPTKNTDNILLSQEIPKIQLNFSSYNNYDMNQIIKSEERSEKNLNIEEKINKSDEKNPKIDIKSNKTIETLSPLASPKPLLSRKNSKEALKDVFPELNTVQPQRSKTVFERKKPTKDKNKLIQSTKLKNGKNFEYQEKELNSLADEKLTEVLENISEKGEEIKIKQKVYLPESKHFSPEKKGILYPKNYQILMRGSIQKDQSFTQQKKEIKETNLNKSISKNSKSFSPSISPGISSPIKSSRSKSPIRQKQAKNNKTAKIEIFDFYIDLLKKCEELRFNIGSEGNSLSEDEKLREYLIDYEDLRIDEKERNIADIIGKKLGRSNYIIIKKIFQMYGEEKNDGLKKMKKFSLDFELYKKISGFSQTNLQLIYYKIVKNNGLNLRSFVEILFRISKLVIKKGENNEDDFRKFIEDFLIQKYRQISLICFEFNVENIQVFYKNQTVYENPVVLLLYECDSLLKHVFSLYSCFDISKSSFSFINEKKFYKFCHEFGVVPFLMNSYQLAKIFRFFSEDNAEIITFSGFVLLLICIAHIGYRKDEKKIGFHQKIKRFCEHLTNANEKISENLIIKQIMKTKE